MYTPRNHVSVTRLHPCFVLTSVILVPGLIGDVACHTGKKHEARWRRQWGRGMGWSAIKLKNVMTVWWPVMCEAASDTYQKLFRLWEYNMEDGDGDIFKERKYRLSVTLQTRQKWAAVRCWWRVCRYYCFVCNQPERGVYKSVWQRRKSRVKPLSVLWFYSIFADERNVPPVSRTERGRRCERRFHGARTGFWHDGAERHPAPSGWNPAVEDRLN